MAAKRKIDAERGALVYLEWNDITGSGGWFSPEQLAETAIPLNRSVGFFVSESESMIVLAQSIGKQYEDPEEYGHPLSFPPGCIRKVVVISAADVDVGAWADNECAHRHIDSEEWAERLHASSAAALELSFLVALTK